MSRRTKRAKRWVVYLVLRFFVAILSLLPLRLALFLGAAGGRLAYAFAARDRRRAIEQLQDALGLDPDRARAVARQVFENAGRVAIEIALLPRLSRILPAYVALSPEDRAVMEEALALGRGVMFVSAHLGNWELLAQRIAHDGFDAVSLAREGPNPYLGRWLVERRLIGKVDTINRKDPKAARKILGALRRGAVLGALLDQDTKVESIHVPFFGRPASTPIAAARLALRGELPVVFGCIERNLTGLGHRVRLERVELAADPGLGTEDRIAQATAQLSRAIEAAVRRRPEEWVWFHDRWKTPPLPND